MTRATDAVRGEAQAIGRAVSAAARGPGRERDLVVQSLKAAAAGLLAWVVARIWLNDPMALMAPWVAVVLVQATVYSSLRRGAQQFAAICAGALIASGAQAVTDDTTGALALSLPLLMLLANWPRFGDQGVYMATTAIFTLTAGPVSASAVGHRIGQAALGAVIGVAVNAFVLPPVHLRDVRENLSALAREAGDTLHLVASGLREGDWDASVTSEWSHAADRLQWRCRGLGSARAWSEESLRLTSAPLRALHRVPQGVPPRSEDERFSRVAGHVTALTRALAVAADDARTPAPPQGEALRLYASLLELIGDACHAEADRLGDPYAGPPAGDDRREEEMEELRCRLQKSLQEHVGLGASVTTVLGTLLLEAESIWAEAVPGRDGDSEDAAPSPVTQITSNGDKPGNTGR
ncbi:FUSC family protein [Streptomyces sp. NPDC028635]|uniref:FUSC family protein n=1 Tax=Streptomyces sp. NPDC028635 TaxID=3154800 RepID=UPI0033CD917A